jgi:hypothetical protein
VPVARNPGDAAAAIGRSRSGIRGGGIDGVDARQNDRVVIIVELPRIKIRAGEAVVLRSMMALASMVEFIVSNSPNTAPAFVLSRSQFSNTIDMTGA